MNRMPVLVFLSLALFYSFATASSDEKQFSQEGRKLLEETAAMQKEVEKMRGLEFKIDIGFVA